MRKVKEEIIIDTNKNMKNPNDSILFLKDFVRVSKILKNNEISCQLKEKD